MKTTLRSTIAGAVVCALLGTAGAAQNHSTGHVLPGQNVVYHVTPGGVVSSAAINGLHFAAVMSADNQSALVFDSTQNAILELDPRTLSVVGTFFSGPALASDNSVMEMTIDQDGSLYLASADAAAPGLGIFKIDASKTLTTVIAGGPSFLQDIRGLTVDIDTGELLVAVDNGTPLAHPVFRIARDGASVQTVVATGFDHRYALHQHIPTGDLFSGSCCGGIPTSARSLLRWDASSNTVSTFLNHNVNGIQGALGTWVDRASAANQRLMVGSFLHWSNTQAGLWHIAIDDAAVSKVATLDTSTYDAVPAFGNNLQTMRVGAGATWDVQVSVPEHPGKRFVIGLSLTGVRPGLPLGDGRTLPLAFDALTALSATGQLAGLLQNNIGTLDSLGGATAQLALTGLPPALNGTRIYAVAVVLDPAAPMGIALIPDPTVVVVDGI